MQMKTPPPVLLITAAQKTIASFMRQSSTEQMTNPPKHKTDFSQRKSDKLEPQNPHKVENIPLTDTNVKRDIRNVFLYSS